MLKKRTITESFDDFDETPNAQTVPFALEGVNYEIELSQENLEEMRQIFEPYITAGRRAGGRKRSNGTGKVDTAAVRAWARDQGIDVPATGLVRKSVIEQYRAAHK